MKSIDRNIIDNAPTNTHFAAVNSGRGFISYFHDVFGDGKIKRRYIIKGGPGTGKSSFMKRAAEYAESRGREVEYFRCSSDPASLDGIIIDGSIAVFDGTAPHVYEPRIAGAEDEIVNLGVFWDAEKLYERYGDIARLSAVRSSIYAKSYKFLSAAMNVSEINEALASTALKREKTEAAARRILSGIPDGVEARLEYGFVNAIGMSGMAHICSFEKKAEKLYCVLDSYGLGWHFLAAVAARASEKKLKVQISYDPLEPEKPDGIYLPERNIAFVLCDGELPEGAVRVNMNRFVDGDAIDRVKAEYRHNRRLYEALLSAAVDALREAGKYHFELEDIYKACMDFDAESRFCEEFCKKHLG
ncbi:MAG: hypothetical protein IJ011_03770 [Clostridia bacterium]|nr:hypothetical protein [Clostridia bacterium]